jgi:diketogulonate reductase-like aldo/keto reductase
VGLDVTTSAECFRDKHSQIMKLTAIPKTQLPSGETVPILGQGTWRMGEDLRKRKQELTALRSGLDLGMSLTDTAEMYGEGRAEEFIADAISGRRDEVFLVSKFYPQNATRKGMIAACERSLRRLKTDRINLYLLHWRGSVPLQETLAGFDELLRAGKIRHWGVSNFDLGDVKELVSLPMGSTVATDQVLYNLVHRGIEWNLLPWCREHAIPIMAYAPVEEGRLLGNLSLKTIASCHGATPAQIALAWLLRQGGMITIPKASRPEHVLENRQALEVHLADTDLKELDVAFSAPKAATPLEMI